MRSASAPPSPRAADVVVIGAGAIGLATARQLAGAGRRVVVLDRDPLGAAASRAAAGMLAPRAEALEPGAFFDLALAARRLFPAFVGGLEAETGLGVDYREDGLLALGRDVDEEAELAARAEWQRAAGLPVEELTRAEAAARWPGLALAKAPAPGEARRFGEGRVFFFPDESQVDAERLVGALLAACRARGVDVRLGVEAIGFRLGQGWVAAVRTHEGEIACGAAVNAAGAWAGAVAAWAGESLPVEPVRGELLAFESGLRPPRPIVASGAAYTLLRARGDLLVGATVERAGFDASVTAPGQAWLSAAASALVPDLAGREPTARWVGLRPGTPDDLPVLGFSVEAANLYHATGHFRNGILLAPLTAGIVERDLARGSGVDPSGEPFRPDRFAARAGDRP